MLHSGLVSITFRDCSVDEIIARVKKAGLDGIEWGGDVHVPPIDDSAEVVAKKCREAGIKIFSYGSYFKAGQGMDYMPVLNTTVQLGAPNVRVWAGTKNSGDYTADERNELVSELRSLADDANKLNLKVSFEYHSNTLTDNADSAVKLIKEIGRDNVFLYWQPNQHKTIAENLIALNKVLPYLSNVHVFKWDGPSRLSLGEGMRDWNEYIRVINSDGRDHALLMEFVKDNDEQAFYNDAEVLKQLISGDISAMITHYGMDIPYSDDISVLSKPVKIKNEPFTLKNALIVHPMEGFDGNLDGSPGELTERRYMRFAASGASLIWWEATAVRRDGRTSSRQLWLHDDNVESYKTLRDKIYKTAPDVPVIMQLTHSGRYSKPDNTPAPVIAYHNPILNRRFNIPEDYPVVTDDYLDRLAMDFINCARLAKQAGFDGVDIKACHRYLLSELLSAYTREGKHGGSYENRTRLFKDIITAIKAEFGSSFAVASRFGIYDAIEYPYGFGTDSIDHTKPDLKEPIKLLSEINKIGVNLINITMGTPYYNPHVNRPYNKGSYLPPEHPLAGVERMIKYSGEVQKALPDITMIGTGYTYLGSAAAGVAAGVINEGLISAVGFGRMAFAYDTFAADMLAGSFNNKKVCITCGKCSEIMRANGTTGCPVRDYKVYAPIYNKYCVKS